MDRTAQEAEDARDRLRMCFAGKLVLCIFQAVTLTDGLVAHRRLCTASLLS